MAHSTFATPAGMAPTAFVNGGIGRVGGTINLIPKRATDEPLTRLTTGYRSDSQFWTHADVGRRFGPAGEWGILANGSFNAGETASGHNAIKVGVASLFNGVITALVTDIPRAPNGRINTGNPLEYLDSSYNMIAGRIEYDILDNTTIYATAGAFSRHLTEGGL